MSIVNQQIRNIEPITGAQIVLGAAVQVVNWDVVVPVPTDLISFGLSEIVTTAPANDPLTAVWFTNVSITINGTHEIVRDFTRAEYINVIQNLEMKEAALISNGEMLWKKFEPALPAKTRIQIALTVNTLALGTTTPAATATGRCSLLLYDAQPESSAIGKRLTFYQRIPDFPPVAGLVANQEVAADLGTESKILKYLVLREFTAAGVLGDANVARYEIRLNGNPICRIPESEAKRQAFVMADGIAVAVGYKLCKLPGRGWNANQATTLHLGVTPHTTVAAGQLNGFQILQKMYA